ncbi:perilipin-2-like [Stegodyphus dumicola]|uniref:perilipin-2-like n=1 Tax=Stegodyphus dumicola TaxID=202533 RepID=UPI0015B15F67|nr:perilipin-2-like [Stegodyphus dumicola]
MTNPEVESAAINTSSKSEEVPASTESTSTEGTIKSEFLERVSEIPAVSAAKDYGTAAYNQVKQYNRFTAAALSAAETAALYFAVTAKPFLEKIQPQAQLVDTLACKGLDTVEEKVPFLMKPPEELVEDARKLCYSTVDKGYQKVEEIKTLGTETLSSVKNYGLQKANDALTGTESLVERYLPPAFGEGSHEAEDDSKSVPERASKLTSKIGLRIYGHGIKQLLPVHKLSQESVAKLLYTVELLQHLKENYINKSVQEYVDEAKVKATWIWEELNKEPAAAEETAKSLEQRMLSLARRMTSVLVHAYNVTAVPISALPKTYQEGFQTAHRYATELFSQFDQATNAGDVTVLMLQGIREKLSALQTVIHGLSSQTEQIEMQDLGSSEKSEDVKEQESESVKEQKSEAGSSH